MTPKTPEILDRQDDCQVEEDLVGALHAMEFAIRHPDETENTGCGVGLRQDNAGSCADCLDERPL